MITPFPADARWPLRLLCKIVVVSIFLLILVPDARAHRVNIFAWVEGDTVHTESKFSGGKRVNDGVVTVYDGQNHKLLEGKTDDQGLFSFKTPVRAELRIELLAGMGHKNEWTVAADEFGEARGGSSPAAAAGQQVPPPADQEQMAAAAPEGLEPALEKALDRKLAPIRQMLIRLNEERTGARDIFAGIGYILGLVGVGAYVHFRRKSKELTEK